MALADNKKDQHITSEAQLRKIISSYPKILDKRICPELDRYCLELIEFSTLIISAYSQSSYPMIPLSKKDLIIKDSKTIILSPNSDLGTLCNGSYASLYFLVPGVGHGLRVNAEIQHNDSKIVLNVKNAYLHCARAAARAAIWTTSKTQYQTEINNLISPENFLSLSPYLLMKTMNEVGETELSPRGDQAGFVYLIDQHRLFIPERPGNKVAVSLRNILKNDRVELLMFIPGTDIVMHIYGNATLTQNEPFLDLAIVNNKRPKLGVLVSQCSFSIVESKAIQQAQPWFNKSHVSPNRLTRFSKALSVHMSGEGILGKTATPFINAIIKNDMKHLY